MSNDMPRRNQLDKMHVAEMIIHDAMKEIEALGADVKLTDAQLLLTSAKNLVSDYLDAHPELLSSQENNNDNSEDTGGSQPPPDKERDEQP
jgi:hypothetical protein